MLREVPSTQYSALCDLDRLSDKRSRVDLDLIDRRSYLGSFQDAFGFQDVEIRKTFFVNEESSAQGGSKL